MPSKIEWTEETWNPVTGCTKISAGCQHCYAERMAHRLAGRFGYPPAPNQFKVTLHPDRLDEPFHWKKPRKVFVCSMGDLFHEDVPDWFIKDVLALVQMCPQHTFQVLTKRPERMSGFFVKKYQDDFHRKYGPIKNLWLGVTAENQQAADERIPWLLKTPAAVRFVSVEPMLGPVDLGNFLCLTHSRGGLTLGNYLDWVVGGGETGPKAREMKLEWIKELYRMCKDTETPFFFKKFGDAFEYDELTEFDPIGHIRQWPKVVTNAE